MTEEFKDYFIHAKVQAAPMTRGDYNIYRGWKIPDDENPDDAGFLIKHENGHENWKPKGVFTEEAIASTGTGKISDGYHTFDELYEFRKMYNAALFNEWAAQGKYSVHKSKRHFDGEECFGGGWFIVVAILPTGQISNHYEMKDWGLFDVRETERALYKFDGHTGEDVIARLNDLRIDEYVGVSVRERIQEISELMDEIRSSGVSPKPEGMNEAQLCSYLVELQEQKNKLSMFLENLETDSSYIEDISRVSSASCSYSGGLTVPGGGMGYEEAQDIVMNGGAVARRGADFILVLQCGSRISKDNASGGAARYLAATGVEEIEILPHIDAVLPGEQVLVGWYPSDEDWEARDWYIVKGPKAPENGPSIEPAPENSGIGRTQCINPSESWGGPRSESCTITNCTE